ncbi:MAG: 3'-5' exonuclease [Planctomycetaceae bacterium]|nr:3'-5' exonuclease [Planctomycetaceae bacterium]
MALVIFDTETGGLLPTHPTIQIAAIAVDANWSEIDRFERKIRFAEQSADAGALAMNHFNPEVWEREAVTPQDAIDAFASFMKAHADCQKISKRTGTVYTVCRLGGHNVSTFDLPRIEAGFKRLGKFFPADFRALDTLQLWRWLSHVRPDLPESGKLTDIAAYYSIDVGDAHDALADCRLSAAIAPRILADLRAA